MTMQYTWPAFVLWFDPPFVVGDYLRLPGVNTWATLSPPAYTLA